MTRAAEFRARAQVEADRYGPDPWIFVRELLQNARDAGATRVSLTVEEDGARTRLTCVDDGEGMSFAHARRYLFSLYSSSKEGSSNQVGRFGVGFWSILRFDPDRIVIRSHTDGEPAWEVELDGELAHGARRSPKMSRGTIVILERPRSDGHDFRRVYDAVWQNARFLRQRDDPELPLALMINGRSANARFELAAPSAAFHTRESRGAVGLGAAPRVELFSRGLRVRSAASLDDLLSSSGHTSHTRVRFTELPGALAPQALLESDALELLLSRSDARDDRMLRRLVRRGQRELRRLVDRQLATIRPPGLIERLTELWRRSVERNGVRIMASVVIGAVLAAGFARLLWGPLDELLGPRGRKGPPVVMELPPSGRAYSDLGARYHGPHVSELDPTADARALPLVYEPADARPQFAGLRVEFDEDAEPRPPGPLGEYLGATCREDCLRVALQLDAAEGVHRIPIPTGHRLDATTVRLDDRQMSVRALGGHPVVELDGPVQGVLIYTTGPATDPVRARVRTGPRLPRALRNEARSLRNQDLEERVEALTDLVRAEVRYETSAQVAREHSAQIRRGVDFVTRALEIGAGDCDVQNGLLAALLSEARVPSRLAIGYVGREGRVSPWLHAWVEYQDGDGQWKIADASEGGAPQLVSPGPAVAAPPTPGEPGPPAAEDGGGSPPPATANLGPGPGAEPELDAGPGAEAGAGDPETRFEAPPWAGVAALVSLCFGLLLAVWSLLRGRGSSSVQLDAEQDLSLLLQGALQKPGAFRDLPALFHRRLVPLCGGGVTSLRRSRELSRNGRLFQSSSGVGLAERAAQSGAEVLDTSTPEGRTVADTLGATDLDQWERRLGKSESQPVLERIAAYMREQGERWQLRASSELGESVASLDLRLLGLARRHDRVVLLDRHDPRLHGDPESATLRFELLDHVLDRIEVPPARRARLLAPLARESLLEASASSGEIEHG